MFKKKHFKVQVSGCSGMAIIALITMIGFTLLITLPLFGFIGLSILLEKYGLSNLEVFSHWYQNLFYFGGFLLLVFGIVFLIDLIGLVVIAALDLEYSPLVNILSTLIQFGICLAIYHEILINIFIRVEVDWLGAGITVALIYLITSIFTSTNAIDETNQ